MIREKMRREEKNDKTKVWDLRGGMRGWEMKLKREDGALYEQKILLVKTER